MNKSTAQIWIAIGMVALWGVALLVAQFDGNTMVKVMTPFMTMALGWLFTDKATEPK